MRAAASARMCGDAGSDGTRTNRKQFAIYCACRWHRGAAAYIWAARGKTLLAHNHVWARGTLNAMAIEKLIASSAKHNYFDFHVSGADVLA
jgi:hypothetical protein